MNKIDLQFIRDTQLMERLARDPMHKSAQEGSVSSLITSEVQKIYDPKNPVSSILAFIGPGLLWMTGFKWLAVIYEVADAFGFNWTQFFTDIKNKLEPLLTGLVNGEGKSAADVNTIVQEAAASADSDNIDAAKIQDVAEKYAPASVNDMLFIKKLALTAIALPSVYEAIKLFLGTIVGKRLRRGVTGFIVKSVAWVIAAIIIAAGFKLVGSTAAKALNIGQDKKPAVNPYANETFTLAVNPNADQHLFTNNYNDDSHVWLINLNISHLPDTLVQWAQQIYPQLDDINLIRSSPKFQDTVQAFRDRNKGADNLEILAVPEPFRSIKDIVDSFAADVAAKMQTTNKA